MAPIHSRRIGPELCEALGLDKTKVRSITLHMEPNTAATAEITQYIQTDEAPGIRELLTRYELIEREAPDGAG